MANRSKLVRMHIRNIGCIGNRPLTVALDDIVCLVGQNNSGKSTVLKAYELARSSTSLPLTDRCKWAPEGEPSEVILEIHIPDGIGNIDHKWKYQEDELLIVKSVWQWCSPDFKTVRKTWSPELDDWAEDGKAGGADAVFNSRLPMPLRIGSLDDADKSEEELLKFLLKPLLQDLSSKEKDPESEICKAKDSLNSAISLVTKNYKQKFDDLSEKLTNNFSSSFERLKVDLDINSERMKLDIKNAMHNSSGLRIWEDETETRLIQQGTGARRALLWAVVQVHTELSHDEERRNKIKNDLEKQLIKERKTKNSNVETIERLEAQISALDDGGELPHDSNDPALPGCLLLIDEPENALHPLAARAAQRHLYRLARTPSWQVMLTTHSPHFINPFVDHTTIVRLERAIGGDIGAIHPSTYQADTVDFDGPTKRRLQALQQLDASLAEIFFGSYPILVEGDTEHAAFIAAVLEADHSLAQHLTVVRARGKALLCPLIRMLRHFKVSFSILHDSDTPYTNKGTVNPMWTENEKIWREVEICREVDLNVRHRICIPDFERMLGEEEGHKDKPLTTYETVRSDDKKITLVQNILNELRSGDQIDPFNKDIMNSGGYMDILQDQVEMWATGSGFTDDVRIFRA